MYSAIRRTLLAVLLTAVVFLGYSSAHAQEATTTSSDALSNLKTQLQNQLDQLETQINQQQQILDQTQTQQASIQRDLDILNAQITQGKLSIQARNIEIEELTSGIAVKNETIGGLNTQLQSELESLGAIMRERDELDTTPLMIVALSSEDLSTFFSDAQTFDEINHAVQQSFGDIQNTKQSTQQQEGVLQNQKNEESQLLEAQQLQQEQIQQEESQKDQILADTKGQEKTYQSLIAQNQQSAAQIRSALFQLNGSAAIPFDKALSYANLAEQKTGIRPAFLLGVLAEESDLGQNVGTGSYTVDMSPANVPAYLGIMSSLGLDPNSMPVSKKQWYGFGGAMGPAQFIPNTWALYAGYEKPNWTYDPSQDRIGPLTGDTPPNPWNPKDAFMAAALYLTDSGAAAQTPTAEFHAAMCYLAGCANSNNASLEFYGNSVAQLASKYQGEINVISSSS